MQETLYQQPSLCHLAAALEPTFKLFIACEDQASFLQARKLQDQVEALCGDQVEISRVFWNFALLRHERYREYAAREAANAEMIVVALSGENELPDHMKNWLESLPRRTQPGAAALVALFRPAQEPETDQQSLIDYLQRTAEDRGLDFFCNRDNWERLDFFRPAFQRMDDTPREREIIISCHVPWITGGINE